MTEQTMPEDTQPAEEQTSPAEPPADAVVASDATVTESPESPEEAQSPEPAEGSDGAEPPADAPEPADVTLEEPAAEPQTEAPAGVQIVSAPIFSSADMPMVAAVGVRKIDPLMTDTERKLKDLGLIP